MKIRIGAALLCGFGAVVLVSILIASVGLQGFQRIARTQNSVIDKAVPVLRETHRIAELNTRIRTQAANFITISTAAERERSALVLTNSVAELQVLADGLDKSVVNTLQQQRLQALIARLNRNLSAQNKLVVERIAQQERVDILSQTIASNVQKLNDLVDALVANAAASTTARVSSLYDMVESARSTNTLYSAFDRLVEVDLDEMERMYELRLRSANLASLVTQTQHQNDPTSLNAIRLRASEEIQILSRRISEINDPRRKDIARSLVAPMQLQSGIAFVDDVYTAHLRILTLNNSLKALNQRYIVLSGQLDDVVNELSNTSSHVMGVASRAARQSLESSRGFFLVISVAAMLLISVTLWQFVRVRVINRLIGLRDTTQRIVAGELDHPIDARGNDELSEMAEALVSFRDSAREKLLLDQKLKEHHNNLERTVAQRTKELRVANADLATEAEEHAAARRKAEQADRAKTDFLATISHELRTPLSVALGSSVLLKESELDQQQLRQVQNIDSANGILLDILDNVLGYSQARAGKIKLNEKPFNLSNTIQRVVGLLITTAQTNNTTINFNIDKYVPNVITADSAKFNQILLNLLGNAVKFTNNGHIDIACRLQKQSGQSALVMDVSDTGIGISQDKQDRVFEAFTQGESGSNRRYAGIGLGLAICQQLCQVMGGEIKLVSDYTEGTRMRVILPIKPNKQSLPDTSERSDVLRLMQARRILVIEDEKTLQEIVGLYLGALQHTVHQAFTGEQGLALLESEMVDLVLLDISLPKLDGLGVIKAIREHAQSEIRVIPVLAMSAHVFEEEIEQYLSAGMDGFLAKPFTRQELLLAVASTLHGETTSYKTHNSVDSSEILNQEFLDDELDALGAEEIYRLWLLFQQRWRHDYIRLGDLLQQTDHQELTRLAHQLRSGAANFGLSQVSALLSQLEYQAFDKHEFTQIYNDLAGAFDSANNALERRLRITVEA